MIYRYTDRYGAKWKKTVVDSEKLHKLEKDDENEKIT